MSPRADISRKNDISSVVDSHAIILIMHRTTIAPNQSWALSTDAHSGTLKRHFVTVHVPVLYDQIRSPDVEAVCVVPRC